MKNLLCILLLAASSAFAATTESGESKINIKPANGATGVIRFFELIGNGTNYVELKAPTSLASNLILVLPGTNGTNGQALCTNGSGTLSWQTVSADLSNLNASNLTSGTVPLARLSNITNAEISASAAIGVGKLGTGGTIPANSGANLTALNASNVSSGTLNDARLSANVPLLNAVSNTFTGSLSAVSFSGSLNATNIDGGTVDDGRLSANVTLLGNVVNTNNGLLQFNNDGYFPSSFLPATDNTFNLGDPSYRWGNVHAVNFTGDGSALTNLNGANIQNGSIADAALSANVPILDQAFSDKSLVFGANAYLRFRDASNQTAMIGCFDTDTIYILDHDENTGGKIHANGSLLTNLTAANLVGALPALDGSALTNISDAALSSNVTLQGNTFNTPNHLAQIDGNGSLVFSGRLNSRGLSFQSVVAKSITTDKNDYIISETGEDFTPIFSSWTSNATRNITGLSESAPIGSAPATGWIYNSGSNNIVFKHQSASSAAGNRIITESGSDFILYPSQLAQIQYDSTATRWRVWGVSGLLTDGSKAGAVAQAQAFTNGVLADALTGNTTTLAITGKVGSSSAGSPITVTGGAGNGAFNGGAITLTGGASGAGATGNSGAINLTTPNASSTNGNGGSIAVTAGNATGTGSGGFITMTAGDGGSNGPGSVALTAGSGRSGVAVTGGQLTLTAGNSGTGATGTGGSLGITSGSSVATNGSGGALNITSGNGNGTGNGGNITITPGTGGASGNIGQLKFPKTVTAIGTTGDQTIHKIIGTVNIAASGTSVTVTNSACFTSSIVLATIQTNDSTAVIKNVVPGNGSFTITLNAAATAATAIGWMVLN